MLKHIPFYASLLGREISNNKKSNSGMVLVYGAIEAHSMGDRGCIASNRLIAEETGLSSRTVANYISELNKAGWIKVITNQINGSVVRVAIEPLLSIATPSHTDDTLHTQMIPPSHTDDTPLHTSVNIDNNKDNILEDSIKSTSHELDVAHLWICTLFGKSVNRYKLTPKRRQKLKSRLKELGSEQIKQAYKAIFSSSFHRGDNDRGWRIDDDPYWLLENAERAEKWANMKMEDRQDFGDRQVTMAELRERGLL